MKLQGRTELDETFVGGKNKNRHTDKKVAQSQGRSFKDKTPVMGMFQEAIKIHSERQNKKDPSKMVKQTYFVRLPFVRCKVVADTKVNSLQPIINAHVLKGSTLISDEWLGYVGLGKQYKQIVVDHGAKQYVTNNGDTSNALEGFWTWLKRAYNGIYHIMSRKHLQAYANEVAFRYNFLRTGHASRFDLF